MFYCYKVTCKVNGKSYIGMTGQTVLARFSAHVRCARRESRLAFHRAIRKYGPDAFSLVELSRHSSRDGAIKAEISCIEMLNTIVPNGYNMTPGGEGVLSMTKESREKHRKSLTEKHQDPEYKERHSAGCRRAMTPERIKKIASIRKGKPMHPNAAAAIREVKKTDEYREIARKAAKRTWDQPGYKEAWIQAKLEKHILKAKRFPMRDDGLIFSSTRSAADHMRNEGHEKAAPNNICLACNGKYKTSYGHHWSWINGDDARKKGGILS